MSALTKYLHPEAVARLAAVGFRPHARVAGNLVGNHPSHRHGFAVEFAGHRQYVPGDNIRHLDWKVYFKSGRYMIKQYEMESNFTAHLLVDISASMNFEFKHGRKRDYAGFISVALASAILAQTDRVAATFFADEIVREIAPTGSDEIIGTLADNVEGLPPKDATALGRVLSLTAEHIGRRQVVFVLSDFFGDLTSLFDGLKRLLFHHNEVILFHVLDPLELNFNLPGRVELIELEGPRRMTIEGRQVREDYNRRFGAFLRELRDGARKLGIDYLLCDTSQNFGITVAKYLNTRLAVGGVK